LSNTSRIFALTLQPNDVADLAEKNAEVYKGSSIGQASDWFDFIEKSPSRVAPTLNNLHTVAAYHELEKQKLQNSLKIEKGKKTNIYAVALGFTVSAIIVIALIFALHKIMPSTK
jgi:hypothetical protein